MKRTLAFLAALLALAACRERPAPAPAAPATGDPQATAPAAKPEPVEIVVWHGWTGKARTALEQVAASIGEREPGLRLTLVEVPRDALAARVAQAIPEGRGPDLFIAPHEPLARWAERQHLLEPITTKVPAEVRERFLPRTVQALVHVDRLYGLPMAFDTLALFYDPDRVAAPPDTAKGLVDAAKAATDPAAGVYGIAFDARRLYWAAPFLHGFGATLTDARGRPAVTGEAPAAALAWLHGLVRAGLMPAGVDRPTAQRMFHEGKAAMILEGPAFLNEIAADKRFGVSLMPTMPPGRRAQPFVATEGLFLSSYGKHKDLALRAMLALTDDASAAMRFRVARQAVANRATWEVEAKDDHDLQRFRTQVENSVLLPSSIAMGFVWGPMDQAVRRAVEEGADPATALAEAQAAIDADLAKIVP